MRATFYGFEAVRKALMTSQICLDVTNQNVANANTDGYTRQKAEISSLSVEDISTKFAKTDCNSAGVGVTVTDITQTRDQFLDASYRKESAEYGKWDTKLTVMTDLEGVFDETTTDGLSTQLTDFYKQLQNFSQNAETVEYASLFRSSAQKVVEVLNQYSLNLSEIEDDQVYNCGADVDSVNQKLESIANLNVKIKSNLIHGTTPNELLDSRNTLLDELSNLVGTSYEFQNDGQVSVKLGDKYLLDSSKNNKLNELTLNSSESPIKIQYEDGSTASITKGCLAGYLEGINGAGVYADASDPSSSSSNGIQYYKKSVDSIAKVFAETLNNINDSTGTKKLFVGDDSGNITAESIQLSQDWLKNAMFITRSSATSTSTDEGGNGNLLKMIECMDGDQKITDYFTGTFEEYSVAVIGDMSVDVKYAQDMTDSTEVDLNSIGDRREAVMGVFTDDESISMLKYQKSYNAAARMMTVMDEMLDVLINDMGLVGR